MGVLDVDVSIGWGGYNFYRVVKRGGGYNGREGEYWMGWGILDVKVSKDGVGVMDVKVSKEWVGVMDVKVSEGWVGILGEGW